MSLVFDTATAALELFSAPDSALREITLLSLGVSASATAIAAIIGFPLGAWVAVTQNRLRLPLIVVLNAALGLPPVVIGLAVYLLLSRSGPLGSLGWLFTPTGMALAQVLLVTPIVAALTRQTVEDAHTELRDWFSSLGMCTSQRIHTLLVEVRFSLIVVLLAAFGRAIAEVGAVMIVGGNIAGSTRVMTTTIALETSKGDLPLALALGVLLVFIVLTVNGCAYVLKTKLEARNG